jgi:hypothetical protein
MQESFFHTERQRARHERHRTKRNNGKSSCTLQSITRLVARQLFWNESCSNQEEILREQHSQPQNCNSCYMTSHCHYTDTNLWWITVTFYVLNPFVAYMNRTQEHVRSLNWISWLEAIKHDVIYISGCWKSLNNKYRTLNTVSLKSIILIETVLVWMLTKLIRGGHQQGFTRYHLNQSTHFPS